MPFRREALCCGGRMRLIRLATFALSADLFGTTTTRQPRTFSELCSRRHLPVISCFILIRSSLPGRESYTYIAFAFRTAFSPRVIAYSTFLSQVAVRRDRPSTRNRIKVVGKHGTLSDLGIRPESVVCMIV